MYFVTEGSGPWSYEGVTGPENWCQMDAGCCGRRQSPIALDTSSRVTNKRPFVFNQYDMIPSTMIAENNGHYVNVKLGNNTATPSISGGGLPGTYNFHSFHFHWGSNSRNGSEHTMYGKTYPTELHLVHYNSKFPDFTTAVASKEPDALAVLGVMFHIALDHNPSLGNLVNQLNAVSTFGKSTILTTPFALGRLLPAEKRLFFRYAGSLTSPGCNQVVVWTVFFQSVPVSESQMCAFRNLLTSAEGEPAHKMKDNFRPVQPLNWRTVYLVGAR